MAESENKAAAPTPAPTRVRFGWPQWLILVAFLFILGFTGVHIYRALTSAKQWHHKRDEPIRGWMTVPHVAHTYHVPPHLLYQALGLPDQPHDKRPLRVIAREEKRSIDDIDKVLEQAIEGARQSETNRPAHSPGQSPHPEGAR